MLFESYRIAFLTCKPPGVGTFSACLLIHLIIFFTIANWEKEVSSVSSIQEYGQSLKLSVIKDLDRFRLVGKVLVNQEIDSMQQFTVIER